jgi:mRNA-degrading endonuclease RelE of RelBE toxin-antitoxin system
MNLSQSSRGYVVVSNKRFAKQLSKLPNEIIEATLKVLTQINSTGRLPEYKSLSGNLRGIHSVKVMVVYRLLILIDHEEKRVTAFSIGHRREIYR